MKILGGNFDQLKVQTSFKNVVLFYDFWSWLTESKAAKEVLELAEIKDKQIILEVACGTGIVLRKLSGKIQTE